MTNTSFSQMRQQSSNLATLQDKIKNQGKKDYSDDRYWKAEQDKAGNASAVIRFLPAPVGEEDAFVKLYSFGFKGPNGQWFIENCPSTIGKECPVLEANNELWNSGLESDKELARARKRRLSYIANILVIKDPANPENEGKVFLFKFGQKIFEKIETAMVPKFDDEDPVNVFDPWTGADFKLRIVRKDKFANYDNSVFDTVKPIAEDDSEIESIWNQQHALQPLVAEDQFKSYDELKTKFDRIVGGATTVGTVEENLQVVDTPTTSTVTETAEETLEDLNLDLDTDDDLEDYKSLLADED